MKEYTKIFQQLKTSQKIILSKNKPTNPLFISVPESYFDVDVKIMIFGQETNDWVGDFPHVGEVEHLLKVYQKTFNNGYSKHGKQFFNAVSKLKERLEAEFGGKSVGLIWNNIIKVGKSGQKGAPPNDILEWQSPMFEIIKKEVEYYQPDIVIFFTGPFYDKYIKRAFDDASFTPVNERNIRQLAKVKSAYLPAKTVRTYHPNYLWRNSFYDYLNEIVQEIQY